MLEVTLNAEGYACYSTFPGTDIFDALTAVAQEMADAQSIEYDFARPIAGYGFIHAHCTKATIKQDGIEIFYFEHGIDCYGKAREDATYDVKCENEEDDYVWNDFAGNNWSEVVAFFRDISYGEVVEIESDC